jgi:hypothetical protein
LLFTLLAFVLAGTILPLGESELADIGNIDIRDKALIAGWKGFRNHRRNIRELAVFDVERHKDKGVIELGTDKHAELDAFVREDTWMFAGGWADAKSDKERLFLKVQRDRATHGKDERVHS